jgi:tetratricopeptide (TPR) repeat protein
MDEAERLGRQAHDARGLVEMAVLRCQTCLPTGNFSAAMESLGSSVDVAREIGIKEELAEGLIHSANTLSYMTRFDEAWEAAQEGMALAQELDDLLKQSELFGGSYVFEYLRRGDLDGALRSGQKGLDLARQIGSVIYQAIAASYLTGVESAMGAYEAAVTHATEAVRLWEMLGPFGAYFSPAVRAGWGTAAAGISPEYFDRTLSRHVGAIGEQESYAGATAWAELGFLALRSGDLDRADELFERGLTVPTSFWLMERPRLLIGSAMVRLARGDVDGASELIEQARAYAEERSMRHVEPMVAFALGQTCFASGDLIGAMEQFDRAADLAGKMRMRPLVVEALDAAINVLGHLGRDVEAERYRVRLREAVEDIRGQIKDPEMLQSFDRAHGVAVHG